MYLLLLTIIFITLVVIAFCISYNPPLPLVLKSSNPLHITIHENISRNISMFNLSAIKRDFGFSGLIRSSSGNNPSYSHVHRIFLDDDGLISSLDLLDLDYVNFNNCQQRHNGVLANGIEDPRIFVFKNEEWGIANCLGSKQQAHPCINTMCIFKLSDPRNTFKLLTPPDGIDSFQQQKNWSPFEWNNKLLCEYSISPHEILEIDPETGETKFLFTSGQSAVNIKEDNSLRGGAPPVLIGDVYLGIGHSRIPRSADYYHFFYIFEAEAPFSILAISPKFKLETTNLIQFAAGLSYHDKNIYISYGVGDKTNRISCYSVSEILTFIHSG